MKPNDSHLALSPQQVSLDVLIEKYAKDAERTIEDVGRRVARALTVVDSDPGRWEPRTWRGPTWSRTGLYKGLNFFISWNNGAWNLK